MPDDQIAVVGAGAVGSMIGAALCYRGCAFNWVVRNDKRRAELDALHLQFPHGGQELDLGSVSIVSSVEDLSVSRLAILAVKAQQVPGVLAALPAGPETDVLVIANGLLGGDYHLGLLYGGAFIQSGVLVCGMENRLEVGQLGSMLDCSGSMAELLQAPFLHCEPVANIRERMWHKLAMNCVINPLTALLDCENGYLVGHLGGPLATALVDELAQVIKTEARGDFDPPSRVELLAEIKQLVRLTKDNSSSMREDLRAGRQTEITAMNLAVAKAGKANGLACTINEMIARMISCLADRGSSRRAAQ